MLKIRCRSPKVNGNVKMAQNGAMIELDEPAYGIASGQLAVFYDDKRMSFGKWIYKNRIIEEFELYYLS